MYREEISRGGINRLALAQFACTMIKSELRARAEGGAYWCVTVYIAMVKCKYALVMKLGSEGESDVC